MQRRGLLRGYLGFEWWRQNLSRKYQDKSWKEHDERMKEKSDKEERNKNSDDDRRTKETLARAYAICLQDEPEGVVAKHSNILNHCRKRVTDDEEDDEEEDEAEVSLKNALQTALSTQSKGEFHSQPIEAC